MSSTQGTGRLFEPLEAALPGFSVSNLLVSSNDGKCHWRQLSRVNWVGERITQQPQKNTMVIGINGACHSNVDGDTTASYGIFFDAESPVNSHAVLQDTSEQTSQLAEIVASTRALNKVETLLLSTSSIKHVILITDSSYLAMGISKHVYQWQQNDLKTTPGREIANRRAFQVLHGTIKRMEKGGISVQFWQVPREENMEAIRLANVALDRHEAKMARMTAAASAGQSHLTRTQHRQDDGSSNVGSRRHIEESIPVVGYAVSAWLSPSQYDLFHSQSNAATRSSPTPLRSSTETRSPPRQAFIGGSSFTCRPTTGLLQSPKATSRNTFLKTSSNNLSQHRFG